MSGSRMLVVGVVAVVIVAVGLMVLGGGGGGGGGESGLTVGEALEVELGESVYRTSCAACHGESGEGQPNWQVRGSDGVLPAPPHDASGHTWHHSDGLLYRIIRDGGAQFAGPTTPSGMPAFGEVLSDGEIRAVLGYLKELWGDEERAFQLQVSEGDPLP